MTDPGDGGTRRGAEGGADSDGTVGRRSLEGRVAVVTGASSGIGRATALALAGEGARVVLAARRVDRLEGLAGRIRSDDAGDGPACLVVPTDVTDRGAAETLASRAVDTFGTIDILVNNAGVMPLSPIPELRVDDWLEMVDVNVKGVLHVLGAVLPVMVDRGAGHVVNVGSVAGRRPFPGGTVYSATKFFVRSLSWGLQLELSAAHGIRVTDIQPGVVDTELADHIPGEATKDGFEARWSGKRKLQADDVARAVVFAVTSPDRVNVNEILVRPTDQPT